MGFSFALSLQNYVIARLPDAVGFAEKNERKRNTFDAGFVYC